jgi:P4 family phage/plasmid primase-like protien
MARNLLQDRGSKMKDKIFAPVPFDPSPASVNAMLEATRAQVWAETPNLPAWLQGFEGPPAQEIIALKNGLLHVPTRRLLPHTRGLLTMNVLPYEYRLGGTPAEWLKFLESVFPGDQESIDTLQEIIAYILTGDTRHHKMFLLYGPPRSGKGTIGRVFRALIGNENFVAPTIGSLATNFGLQPLIGKLVAVISDARIGRENNKQTIVEHLLMISGEDAVSIPRKFRDDWTGKLPTRFVILTNELPRLGDSSGALASRFIVLTMRQSFLGREDTELTERLLKELPDIFSWALDGIARLRARGCFLQPKAGKEASEDLARLNSPTSDFADECCCFEANLAVPAAVLFAAWVAWATKMHTFVGDNAEFGKRLKEAFPKIERRQIGREWHYVGIGLKPAFVSSGTGDDAD